MVKRSQVLQWFILNCGNKNQCLPWVLELQCFRNQHWPCETKSQLPKGPEASIHEGTTNGEIGSMLLEY